MADNLLPNPWDEDHTRRNGLKEYFIDRSIAEMSIWFCIAAISSLILMVLGVATALHLTETAGESHDTLGLAIILGGLILWIGFLGWLWISLVRIARGWGPEHLGTHIFKHLQMGFFFATALTMLGHGMLPEDLQILFFVLLAFDFVIMGMTGFFLLLAWSARCKVPWRTYREVFVMAILFVLQIILMTSR